MEFCFLINFVFPLLCLFRAVFICFKQCGSECGQECGVVRPVDILSAMSCTNIGASGVPPLSLNNEYWSCQRLGD